MRKSPTIHQITGKMADAVLKSSAIERSYDNLTIVIVAFKNLQTFYDTARKKQMRKTQTIKIEGENSPRRVSSNMRREDGYQTTKTKKTKELMNSQMEKQSQNRNRQSVSSNRSNRGKSTAGTSYTDGKNRIS